jgi:hypothetical protein
MGAATRAASCSGGRAGPVRHSAPRGRRAPRGARRAGRHRAGPRPRCRQRPLRQGAFPALNSAVSTLRQIPAFCAAEACASIFGHRPQLLKHALVARAHPDSGDLPTEDVFGGIAYRSVSLLALHAPHLSFSKFLCIPSNPALTLPSLSALRGAGEVAGPNFTQTRRWPARRGRSWRRRSARAGHHGRAPKRWRAQRYRSRALRGPSETWTTMLSRCRGSS